MQRWIVEGIRWDDGRLDAKVAIVQADSKAAALVQMKHEGAMEGYQLSTRPATPEDNVGEIQRNLTMAVQDAGRELDRLVDEAVGALQKKHQPEPPDEQP